MYMQFINLSVFSLFLFLAQACAQTKTVLLLGPTGVGKTTIVNALYNASISNETPLNSVESLRFIVSLRNGRGEDTPRDQCYLDQIETILYGGITRPLELSQRVCCSDTSDFIGYRFTPNFSGWPADTALEIIDMPGIDDTSSRRNDNNSAHIQVIKGIEELFRKRSDELAAVFIVVNDTLIRCHETTRMTMAAIREALPPQALERVFIVINRCCVEMRDVRNEELQDILKQHLFWNEGALTIPEDRHIKIDPAYIADFNRYVKGVSAPHEHQAEREWAEKNLRVLLRQVGQFNTAMPLCGYPEYLDHKHNVAEAVHAIVETQMSLDDKVKHLEKLQEEYKEALRTYNNTRGRKESADIEDVAAGVAVGSGIGAAVSPLITAVSASVSMGVSVAVSAAIGGIAKLFADHKVGVDDPVLRRLALNAKDECTLQAEEIAQLESQKEEQTQCAQAKLEHMLASDYAQTQRIDKATLAAQIKARIHLHFPELYREYSKRFQIDHHIEQTCQDFRL